MKNTRREFEDALLNHYNLDEVCTKLECNERSEAQKRINEIQHERDDAIMILKVLEYDKTTMAYRIAASFMEDLKEKRRIEAEERIARIARITGREQK